MSILQSLLQYISWLSYPLIIVGIIIFISKIIAFINIKRIETVLMPEETKFMVKIINFLVITFLVTPYATVFLVEFFNINFTDISTKNLLEILIGAFIISFLLVLMSIPIFNFFFPYRRFYIEEGQTKLYIIKTTKDDLILLSTNPMSIIGLNENEFYKFCRKEDILNWEIKEEKVRESDIKVFINKIKSYFQSN
ncbi:hypothetical protein CathTA2_0117 [Caldalkalibacillus thermarum TA2.A1]|uniref:Uncharacterized protein n=1 Tax=Caldalkalibacillus thermarum (strain TA2.A1) TaxID=986075 RepID=F5LBC8_CALTT|nr:hypothetical protein [Caldalkalibacillus thermarum]EGL81354.1 hypothetical protein CathTA2_0117 [Caldalkalibacillus thermarum TA2.A1]QZT34563.1 hypothetical protein HUR95_04125 [Caldalkalibacillus thermarum TA2.A1]